MANELLQLLPIGQQRRQSDAWKYIERKLDDLSRGDQSGARTASQSDRQIDRLVPQVFAAKITSSSSQAPISATRNWWLYSWVEVERTDAGVSTWTVLTSGRDSTYNGTAINSYETTIDDDGGNAITAVPVRLPYPTNAVVEMIIDSNGRAWFDKPNPVQIC